MILVAFSFALVSGCKDNSMSSDNVDTYSLNSASGLSSVGNEHNLILDYLSFDTTYSIIDTINSRRLFDSTLSYLVYINNNYDSVEISYYGRVIADIVAGKNIDTVLKDHFDAIFPDLALQLSQVEINMINEARNYIDNYNFEGMTNTEVYNHIISKADSLLISFNSIDWDTVSSSSYMKGEAIGGYLAIMKNSAEYWKTQTPSTSNVDKPAGFVQVDATGYLIGWGKATVLELWDNGHLDINNSNHRIGAGVVGASFASGGKALKVFSSWLSKVIKWPR